MTILVLDGQGGGVGRSIIEEIKKGIPNSNIIAVGTNSAATANMIKGGGIQGATGEAAIAYNADRSDIIIAPMGAFFSYGMLGEISPTISNSIAKSKACKIAIPTITNPIIVASHKAMSLTEEIAKAISFVKDFTEN